MSIYRNINCNFIYLIYKCRVNGSFDKHLIY